MLHSMKWKKEKKTEKNFFGEIEKSVSLKGWNKSWRNILTSAKDGCYFHTDNKEWKGDLFWQKRFPNSRSSFK